MWPHFLLLPSFWDFLHDFSRQQPSPAPPPPLSGISICKMDLGTVVLGRINPQHLWKSLASSGGQFASGAGRGATRQPGHFTWRRPLSPGPRAWRNLPGSFPTTAEPSGARSGLGVGSPGLDFSSSPAGRDREGAGGPGHWRENVRNVPGPSTYPRRGQRKGAGLGEGRGARLRAPEKTCLFSRGWSPVRASSPPCKFPAAPSALRLAPRACRRARRGRESRSPASTRPSARHVSRAPVPGRAVETPLARLAERRQGAPGSLSSPVTGTTPGLSFPIHNLHPPQTYLLGFRWGDRALGFLFFIVSKETDRGKEDWPSSSALTFSVREGLIARKWPGSRVL